MGYFLISVFLKLVSFLYFILYGRGADAELVVLTHVAREDSLANTVKDLRNLDVVQKVVSVIRVEGVL